ncbi:hypothetical protein F53441_5688 [Fusarium austroafricanum]|uniref:Uncharacterized protein n=1 Tax=Fusarium austroafricanum TaxID=2364996 RepID=A0A8H4KHF3_9HYPO|nr:hypothetical protein F53441_5688 [Fusarium austroafricanum]
MTINLVIPQAHRVPPAVYVFIILTCSFFLLLSTDWLPTDPISDDGDRKFAFIVLATSPNPNLCKTIISALALGYPSPVIVNWGINPRAVSKWYGGQNLLKIPGIVKYLDAVMHPDAHPSERLRENDLVLIVDGYDVWFQLPAQILLERYHRINKEANERLYRQWNKRGPMPMKQTILVAAGKRCAPVRPESGGKLRCDEWPQSPLRTDLYGPGTEKNGTYHQKVRPRWINDGVYIGPAGDMRRLFRRLQEKMEKGVGLGYCMDSSQATSGEVMAEQEVWRKWARENRMPRLSMLEVMESSLEFHMGLDYSLEIAMQTMWTENLDGSMDGGFVQLGDQPVIEERSKALGIIPTRLRGLPDDIKAVKNPLSDLVPGSNWTDMPLYADFYTESVPVILHHNGMDNLKWRRSSWWDKPWYYQHLRQLLKFAMKPTCPDDPLATVKLNNGRVRYWALSAEEENRYPRQFNETASERMKKMKFGDICRYKKKAPKGPNQQWWEEVFRDTGGPWK